MYTRIRKKTKYNIYVTVVTVLNRDMCLKQQNKEKVCSVDMDVFRRSLMIQRGTEF